MRGSLFTSAFGVEAAPQHLGHRDISTTTSDDIETQKVAETTLSTTGGRLTEAAS